MACFLSTFFGDALSTTPSAAAMAVPAPVTATPPVAPLPRPVDMPPPAECDELFNNVAA